jgi:hypothetical protein
MRFAHISHYLQAKVALCKQVNMPGSKGSPKDVYQGMALRVSRTSGREFAAHGKSKSMRESQLHYLLYHRKTDESRCIYAKLTMSFIS